jgi:hypothetical protein
MRGRGGAVDMVEKRGGSVIRPIRACNWVIGLVSIIDTIAKDALGCGARKSFKSNRLPPDDAHAIDLCSIAYERSNALQRRILLNKICMMRRQITRSDSCVLVKQVVKSRKPPQSRVTQSDGILFLMRKSE